MFWNASLPPLGSAGSESGCCLKITWKRMVSVTKLSNIQQQHFTCHYYFWVDRTIITEALSVSQPSSHPFRNVQKAYCLQNNIYFCRLCCMKVLMTNYTKMTLNIELWISQKSCFISYCPQKWQEWLQSEIWRSQLWSELLCKFLCWRHHWLLPKCSNSILLVIPFLLIVD